MEHLAKYAYYNSSKQDKRTNSTKLEVVMVILPAGVAIIGAGLAVSLETVLRLIDIEKSETALALALHRQNIPCTIYESRSNEATEVASGVVLTPNRLRILDDLVVLSRIKDRCWLADHRTYKNDEDVTTRKTLAANEDLYGFKDHRLWRRILLMEMKIMLEERCIDIVYKARFGGIIAEDETGVHFLINGEIKRASMLIGTDGTVSTVRKYIDPDIRPEYTGTVGALAHIRRDSVRWPYADYEPQFTLQGKPGAFFTMPEDPKAEHVMVGMQVQRPEQARAEWDALCWQICFVAATMSGMIRLSRLSTKCVWRRSQYTYGHS